MEEPVRLICPECDTVYRVKKLTLGKAYGCKKCGAPLTTMSEEVLACPECGARSEPAHLDVSRRLHCAECQARPALVLLGAPAASGDTIAAVNRAAAESANRNVAPPPLPAPDQTGEAVREALERVIENGFTKALERFERRDDALAGRVAELAAGSRALEERVGGLSERMIDQQAGDAFLERIEAGQARGLAEVGDLVRGALSSDAPFRRDAQDEDAAAAKVLSRLDDVMRAGETESLRLEQVLGEVRQAAALVAELERRVGDGDIPDRVAEVVGRRIEDHVAVPMTKALVQRIPEVLSRAQSENMAEVVSRSVRDAQRPLLREIVAGGRGVPLWLFASLLIPLLLILGYLFLPGELGLGAVGGDAASLEAGMAKLAAEGVPLTPDADQRLRDIEGAVFNMQDNVWGHVEMAGKVEAEIANLRRSLAEREQALSEANAARQKQARRLRAYEIQLTRLGISPDTIPDGPEN